MHAGVHGQLNSLEKVIIIILSRNRITKYIISMITFYSHQHPSQMLQGQVQPLN